MIRKNRDPGLWIQLSEVQRAGKNIVGYHLSRGEYYTLIGDFDNALNQFQFALGLSGNSFQTSETIMTKDKICKRKIGQKKRFLRANFFLGWNLKSKESQTSSKWNC